MSEQKKPKSFMQELDQWTETKIIGPIESASDSPHELEVAAEEVKKLIRAKVLESYRNGQGADPSKPARKEPRR